MKRDGRGLIAALFWNDSRAQGYEAVTIQEYGTIGGTFCDAIEKHRLRSADLDGATTERL